jgi:hypothetical protein
VDGGAQVVETFTGTLQQGETANFSFAQTADFSEFGDYNVMACTDLDGDEFPNNDCFSTTVTHFEFLQYCEASG